MSDIYNLCKDCSKEFYIKDSDQQWYSQQGYELPKRCHGCRQKRKAEKEAQLGVSKHSGKPKKDDEYSTAWRDTSVKS